MIHVKDEQSPKHLWTLSEMVFYVLFLFLLPHGCKGSLQVIGSSEPIVVNVGDDVMLPCLLKPSVDAATQTVEWTRPDLKPRFVHLWRSGEELMDDQNPSYVGRTSLFISEFKNGNVSLKLSRVKLSDKGKYRCFMPNINRDTTVELTFGSVSSSSINISKSISGLSLDCTSEGWFPQPEVVWLDGKGKVLSAEPKETTKGPDNLFNVQSRLTLEKSNDEVFTCRVHQEKINQTRETHIHISADLFEVSSSVAVSVTITVFVMLGIFAAAGLIFWKRRQNQTKEENQLQDDAENGDGSSLIQAKDKIKHLEEKNRKMEGQLIESQGKNRKLEEKMEGFQEKKKTLEGEMVNFQVEKKSLEREMKDFKEEKRTLEREMTKLQVEKGTLEVEIKNFQEKKSKLEREKKEFHKDMKTQEREMTNVQVEKRTLEREQKDFQDKRGALEREMTNLQMEKGKLEVEIKNFLKQKSVLEIDLANLQVEKERQEREMEDLQETMNSRKGQGGYSGNLGRRRNALC